METMSEEHPDFDASPQTARLLEVLEVLEERIKNQNSYKNTFLRGALYGLGTVIGATILVALFGGVIAATINTFGLETNFTKELDRSSN